MASIFRRPRSPYWFAAYTDATGRRRQKTTKTSNRALALDFAIALEKLAAKGRAGTLTEAVAREAIGELVLQATGEPLVFYTAAGWLDHWLSAKTEARAGSTAERYKQVKRDFLESLGNRAKLNIAAIGQADVLKYRRAEMAAGKSPKTANLSVKIVSAAFNAALRQGLITTNPCLGIDPLDEATAERHPFKPDQISALLRAATGDWRRAILLGYYTGARLGDVVNLKGENIDHEHKLVTFTPQKTKRRGTVVKIPLHPDLERALLEKPCVGKAFLLPDLAGKTTGGAHGLSAAFAAIMARAGIVGKVTRHTETGRANTSLSFHSLRHSFNSAMANAGISQEIRQKLTGHTSAEQNTAYTHHELEPLRLAVSKLQSVDGSGTT